jgi:hypothetical protein
VFTISCYKPFPVLYHTYFGWIQAIIKSGRGGYGAKGIELVDRRQENTAAKLRVILGGDLIL